MLEYFKKTKDTIEVLAANMINTKIISANFFLNYKEASMENCHKLVIRCKKLYDAREKAKSLLKSIVEIETLMQPKSTIWRLL